MITYKIITETVTHPDFGDLIKKAITTLDNNVEIMKEAWTVERDMEIRQIRVNDINKYMSNEIGYGTSEYITWINDTRVNAQDYINGDDTYKQWFGGSEYALKTYYSLVRKTFIQSILNP